jgi:hypothetical protein
MCVGVSVPTVLSGCSSSIGSAHESAKKKEQRRAEEGSITYSRPEDCAGGGSQNDTNADLQDQIVALQQQNKRWQKVNNQLYQMIPGIGESAAKKAKSTH